MATRTTGGDEHTEGSSARDGRDSSAELFALQRWSADSAGQSGLRPTRSLAAEGRRQKAPRFRQSGLLLGSTRATDTD
eukprot:CAMPEP_0176285808 /NCGR_PEP_ID=MMETSP0121_2-20121125/52569_1 /TAXON_ID=160619 /ORGANISM="Kryptoperidinium foliaceum, Strain CCMP 1326" /LENGTH=77 /DNA_ID=CAMNT_0017626321 /DNA_START=43 /DNA_END=273 /DNA_ORIENTATION=+